MFDVQSPLSAASSPLCSLGLYTGRVVGSVVGRPRELAAIEQELEAVERGLTCLTLEGEPGIGKTRLLLAIEEMTRGRGFMPIAVTADEEIRGPFLLARSVFACPMISDVQSPEVQQAVEKVTNALTNQDDPGLANLQPDQKLLRIFDLAAVALRLLAKEHPIALIIDDLQWADGDSLRLLRYVARVDAASRILFVLAIRPAEMAFVNEAVTLLADLERIGLVRRLKLSRFTQVQSTEFLQQLFGGQMDPASAAIMHAQAEGVPFVLAEQAHAYRDSGLIQQIQGTWTLSPNAERLLPSAVRTLIERRAVHLPEETKSALAEAGILGRSFSLRDLVEVKRLLGDSARGAGELAQSLEAAVAAGLLMEQPNNSPADYSFTHDQIREYAVAGLPASRRRAIHGAIVDILMGGASEPPKESLPLLAQHALAAGRNDLCVRFSVGAAEAALKAKAPDEVLRLVRMAQAVASVPKDRVALLCLQDDALEMLRRQDQRQEGLSQLGALAEAMGDSHLELEVRLRRAASLRLAHDEDSAAEISRQVRQSAADRGDEAAELAACLELGQDLLRTELGAGYTQTPSEADLDGAAETYKRAAALAERLHDDSMLAAASRELGTITVSRIRIWFIEGINAGALTPVMQRVASGERLGDIMPTLPVAPALVAEAKTYFQRALEIYERLGDRQGAMATIIAIAIASWGPQIHVTGSAKRIEEIRRLMGRMKSLTKESERVLADAQMLFGSHVYALAKGMPDVALIKGEEAYRAARGIGERSLEFAAAGGMACANAQLLRKEEANRWLGLAAAVVSGSPTPGRARRLELWRGAVLASAGDARGMQEHLERAAQMATEQERPAARCEALALLALEAARLGRVSEDESLLSLAERCAQDVLRERSSLPGHPQWPAQALSARASVALTKGDASNAAESGRQALAEHDTAMREDLDLDIILPAADAIIAGGTAEEAQAMRDRLQIVLGLQSQRILDENVRAEWFRGETGRDLTRLAGPLVRTGTGDSAPGHSGLAEDDSRLLSLLVEGRTNWEIAEEIGASEQAVALRLAELFVRIGASSRADATVAALAGGLV
ncbi:MAG TPA: AAA family ATPase [Dehalococcoidia bacterium]|nr:AAA family ATPase [Dehalococcoidia bacterium]